MITLISQAQCFGEHFQVAPFNPADIPASSPSHLASVSIWPDSDLTLVVQAVKEFHAAGVNVIVKRHVDTSDPLDPYRLSYFRMPWLYASFAAKVRSALTGYLVKGDSIEIANEPAYGVGDTNANGNQLTYSDNTAVWRDLFAAIAFEDRQAFPGVEIIGPLSNGMQPEVVKDLLNGSNLTVQAFQPFDSVSAHLYPNGSPVAGRIAQLAAFSKWSGKPVRITEAGGPVAGGKPGAGLAGRASGGTRTVAPDQCAGADSGGRRGRGTGLR